MAGLYMRDRRFAREVSDLEPPWASTRWSLVRILRRFDEAGVVRPVLRLHLPVDFGLFDFRYPYISDEDFTSGQVEEFTAVRRALAVAAYRAGRFPATYLTAERRRSP